MNTKLYKDAHVFVCFKPNSYTDAAQALGRGERKGLSAGLGTLIVSDKEDDNIPISQLLQFLENQTSGDGQQEKLRCKVLQKLNNLVFTGWAP